MSKQEAGHVFAGHPRLSFQGKSHKATANGISNECSGKRGRDLHHQPLLPSYPFLCDPMLHPLEKAETVLSVLSVRLSTRVLRGLERQNRETSADKVSIRLTHTHTHWLMVSCLLRLRVSQDDSLFPASSSMLFMHSLLLVRSLMSCPCTHAYRVTKYTPFVRT